MGSIYLDSSALLKVIQDEPESRDAFEFLDKYPVRTMSALSRVEVRRALLRQWGRADLEDPDRATLTFLTMNIVEISPAILAHAEVVAPFTLRSLDAIHLASALSIPDLEGMMVYDRRLAKAAQAAGVIVWSPGQAG